MTYVSEAFVQAITLITGADRALLTIASASLRFSASSTFAASLIAVPLGVSIATTEFPGKRLAIDALKTLLAIPTVVVGLFVYTLVFNQGPMGSLRLLFTPSAIVLGQTVLILPLITALTYGAAAEVSPLVRDTARTLGAGPWRTLFAVAREARPGILVAIVTGLGRVIGEIGVSMMLGGNIAGYTRTITTAIALETSKGEFALGIALGLVLLTLAFLVNITIRLAEGARR